MSAELLSGEAFVHGAFVRRSFCPQSFCPAEFLPAELLSEYHVNLTVFMHNNTYIGKWIYVNKTKCLGPNYLGIKRNL